MTTKGSKASPEKAKANPDYSASMVRPTNPEVVINDWHYLNDLKGRLKDLDEAIVKHIPPELLALKVELEALIAKAENLIRVDIEEWGSYQDTTNGRYALKSRSERLLYKPELVRLYASDKVANFVLVESVDTKAMEAMLKSKSIDPETARKCAEVEQTFRFIVK